MAVIAGLTTVNYLGVRFGGSVQVLFTSLKVAAILVLVTASLLFFDGSAQNFTQDAAAAPAAGGGFLLALVAALSGAFWAYDGWNNITYVAGEVREPQKTIPRALLVGTLVVIAVYVLVNLAYLWVLPVEGMAASQLVASDVARRVLGPMGGAFVAAAVMVSTFGTSNGTILASARCHFALARAGRFFPSVGGVHPRFQTPGTSLAWQAAWACVLVVTGTFDTLTDTLIFVSWVFYALGAAGVFVLRRRMPDAPRPYRVPLYPWLPGVFVLVATAFVAITLANDVAAYVRGETPFVTSVFGLALVAAGVPLYAFFGARSRALRSEVPHL
jgi:APA family basic amino acid/polyamine antiporter